jgi:hypothetical protein
LPADETAGEFNAVLTIPLRIEQMGGGVQVLPVKRLNECSINDGGAAHIWGFAGSMRHMMPALPTETHILPSTIKTIPPNIRFSSMRRPVPKAVLKRSTTVSSGGIAVLFRSLVS